jgi:hypothetical protein
VAFSKPFHRNVRGIKHGPNSAYSGWAYVEEPEYAKNPEHYVRAFTLILNDLQSIFEYLEPSDECREAYSYRIHALLMRTCIEVEANFKAILEENSFTPPRLLNMSHYRKVDATHHLSSYEVMLPIWNGTSPILRPFEPWKAWRGRSMPQGTKVSLPWYQAYNASKHDRQDEFKNANFGTLVDAVAGLLVLISSQFRHRDFSAGPDFIGSATWLDTQGMEPSTGSLFRIKYPEDWTDDELYDFDWSAMKTQKVRYEKINFDAIPS